MDRRQQYPSTPDGPLNATKVETFERSLGPMPYMSLSAMVNYGLSDAEIGRYYALPAATIIRLRTAWRIISRL